MAKAHGPGFVALVESVRETVQEISAEELEAWRAQGRPHVLIDVREDHEWTVDHLEGAVHLGRGILERDVEERFADPETELVLYCGGGFRSALSADSLQKMGYRKVWSLAGGIRRWRELGLPLTRG